MGFVLGLNGVAGAGKDTVADYLVSRHGWDGKISFAFNLKELCSKLFSLTPHDLSDQDGKRKYFPTPLKFGSEHLNGVLAWMCKTHPNVHPMKGSLQRVKDKVGTELLNPRHALQFIGTDICRELIPSYHIDVLAQVVKQNAGRNMVATDVRFPNEGDVILDEFQGMVVNIIRHPEQELNIDSSHPSETAMLSWGRFSDVIDNQLEGLRFLYSAVDLFLEKHNLCRIL